MFCLLCYFYLYSIVLEEEKTVSYRYFVGESSMAKAVIYYLAVDMDQEIEKSGRSTAPVLLSLVQELTNVYQPNYPDLTSAFSVITSTLSTGWPEVAIDLVK